MGVRSWHVIRFGVCWSGAVSLLLAAACSSTPAVSSVPADCADGTRAGCVVKSDQQRVENPQVSDQDLQELVRGNTALAFDLYRELGKKPGNFFYSPTSISVALAMTSAGARGQTAEEMASALHFSLPQDRLHPAMDKLDLALASRGQDAKGKDGEPFRLDVANAVWGQTGYAYQPPFLDTLAEYYGAGLRVVDFSGAPDEARGLINNWVSDQTAGKIPELLGQGTITPLTRLVLTNTVYFNASWREPFKPEKTADGDFHMADGATKSVPLMHGWVEMPYAEGADYQAADIPYDGDEVAMLVIVPKAGQLASFESTLDAAKLGAIVAAEQGRGVTLTLPKFKIDSSFDLADVLGRLGMHRAFSAGDADFSGITTAEQLYISDVVHKATVSVDENGTEAAAATGVIAGTTSAPEPAELVVDRPFIFLIHDAATGAVIFTGRVVDPG